MKSGFMLYIGSDQDVIVSLVPKFERRKDRDRVLKAAPGKLKDSPYSVYEQFPNEIMERRNIFLPVLKREQRMGKNVKFKEDKLYVNGQRIYPEDVLQMRTQGLHIEKRTKNGKKVKFKEDKLYVNGQRIYPKDVLQMRTQGLQYNRGTYNGRRVNNQNMQVPMDNFSTHPQDRDAQNGST
ncbi:unnamed protein product [Mytilus coruscus]|uniref:Uncharacterized protein n=1 Tax=Mytilus coruscus TaxID=42192 RepID=A0A6J8CR11_MYTCO|nr:unnamed protein product [Mytilus coruscus]